MELHAEMLAAGDDRRRHSAARSVTLVTAILVHVPALILLVGAVALVWFTGHEPVTVAIAILLFIIAVVMRPRLGNLPRQSPVLARSNAPTLFGLTDDISRCLKARGIDWIAFDLDYNCGTRLVGLRRRRLIVIGLPLWVTLSNPERVAVLAHEIAHDTNGDLAHSLVVGSALQILLSVTRMLTPPRRHSTSGGSIFEALEALAAWLAALVMRGLSALTYLSFRLLLRYARRASPRAEYLADQESARVGSAEAATRSLDKLCLARPALLYLAMAARDGEADLWGILRTEMGAFSPKEHERLRRLAKRAGHRVDETHPPTALRIEILGRLAPTPPLVVVTDGQAKAIDREVAQVESPLADAR
jgi:Zn-dependent protease with chaperone function